MTASVLPPNQLDAISDLKERVFDLERRLRRLEGEDPPQDICTFPGILFAGTSPPFYPTVARSYIQLLLALGTAGSTTTTVRLLLDGVTFGTYTITASATLVSHTIDFVVATSQRVNVQVVTAGTSSANLTAHLRY